MDGHFHDIDNLFQKATERHSELPSDAVWEHLEKDLQKRNITSVTKKYKKWKWAALLLIITAIAIGTYCLDITRRYNNAVKKLELQTPRLNNTGSSSSITVHSTHQDYQKEYNSISPEKGNLKNTINLRNGDPTAHTGKIAESESIKNKKSIDPDINKKQRRTAVYDKDAVVYKQLSSKQQANGIILKKVTASQSGKIKDDKKGNTNEATVTSLLPLQNDSNSTQTFSTAALTLKENSDLLPALVGAPLHLISTNTDLLLAWLTTNSINRSKPVAANGYKAHTRSTYRGLYTAALYYGWDKSSTLIEANHPDYREDNYQQVKNHEKNRLSNSVNFSLSRSIGRNWSIESGIGQTIFITDIYAKPLVARRDNSGNINYRISTSSGYAYYIIKALPRPGIADSIRTLSSKSIVKYFSVPVGITYYFKLKKISLAPAVYVSVNYKTSGKMETIQSAEHTYSNDIEGLRPGYFDVGMRLGINYYLSKTIGVGLRSYTRFALSNATEGSPVISRRNTAGLAAGINLHF